MSKPGLFLFLLLLLLLPAQLGRHLWPNFAYVSGLRVDYLSPTIYLTDIIILLLFASWISSRPKVVSIKHHVLSIKFDYWKLVVLVFFGSIIVGILLSKNPMAGAYGTIKFLEFFLLGLLVAKTVDIKKMWTYIGSTLSIGIIFESILAMVQFYNQSSLGGFFWFLGERTFTGTTPGIANVVLDGQLWLRPYGTLSHPNVLAGYLTVAMATVISNFHSRSGRFPISNIKKILFGVALMFGSVALILTMSRVAILLWLLIVLFWFWKKFSIQRLLFIILSASIAIIFLLTPLKERYLELFLPSESSIRREELTKASLLMIRDYPVLGVGLNNFLVKLPAYQKTTSLTLNLQPVHNIYLLIGAETGLVGLGFFLWFIVITCERIRNNELGIRGKASSIHNSKFILLSTLLIIGFFDHYFLTLQQGQLLFAIIFGFCWAKEKS